ncbi:unnamed protein product [Echinostoma caproni]|uniref:Transmembrane protein n=1 Tax=Echinostoma caproni TaxID=27848 RepID=A0A183B2N7_9TREM|nr:unnamed protein product [Echinostoma caproni]
MKDSGPSSIGERTGVLIHGTSEDVPPNAILLSPSDVYRLRKSQLWSWNNRSEVWPLIYGPRLAAATVGISSFVANINARQLFNLRGQKFFWSTIMPTLAFPITCYWAAQELLINRPILSRPPQPWNGEGPCDLCLEVRASVLQVGYGESLSFFYV